MGEKGAGTEKWMTFAGWVGLEHRRWAAGKGGVRVGEVLGGVESDGLDSVGKGLWGLREGEECCCTIMCCAVMCHLCLCAVNGL